MYHVMHIGGRNAQTYPVNSNAAESRRSVHFNEWGHTPSPAEQIIASQPSSVTDHFAVHEGGINQRPVDEVPTPEFLYTLDLRRPPY